LNQREHWRKRAERARLHRQSARFGMEQTKQRPALPCVITLIRVAPRPLDGDNNQGSLKSVRDGVADWLRIDDGSDLVTWKYEQRRGKPKQYTVIVEVS
jgi:hypothetical protein